MAIFQIVNESQLDNWVKQRKNQSFWQLRADMSRGDYTKTESLMRGRFDSSKAHFR